MNQTEKSNKSIELIINSAISEFAKNKSVDDTSMNVICQKHGISKGKLYYHFSSKEDIFVACVERIINEANETFLQYEIDDSKSAADNILDYYGLRIKYWCRHPEEFSVIHKAVNIKECDLHSKIAPIIENFNNVNRMEILKMTAKEGVIKNIPIENAKEFFNIIYAHLFSHDIRQIVAALHTGNEAEAKQKTEKLMSLYKSLVHVILYGIME